MALQFAEIEPVSLKDRVIDAVKEALLNGQLKPGDAIVERELARQMAVGIPVIREALIALHEQGFVRRVANTGTFVTQFSPEEIGHLYALRVEFETLAFQWARSRVTAQDIERLTRLLDQTVDAGESGDRRAFLQSDYNFHRECWRLSGNPVLLETLDRLMSPLFPFVVFASGAPLTARMAREHYTLVDALQSLQEPEFTAAVRQTLHGFAARWLARMGPSARAPRESE